jgi:hypothetical protein
MFSQFFFFENHAVHEIMWKNIVEPDRPQMTISHGAEKMRVSCQIAKARMHTHTHTIFNKYCFSSTTKVTR